MGAGEGNESFVHSASIIGLVIRFCAWSQRDFEVEEVVWVYAVRSATDAAMICVDVAYATTASSRFVVSLSAAAVGA